MDSLVEVFESKGNPFLEMSNELYNIDTQGVASKDVVVTIMHAEEWGRSQYHEFVENRLKRGTVQLMDTISLNKYPLFKSTSVKKNISMISAKLADAKEDSSLCSRLWIACQTRKGDPQEFFKHENHLAPPSLSLRGEMRVCKKADLLTTLIKATGDPTTATTPPVTAKMIDGAATVNMLRPGTSRNFQEYANNVFIPYILRELSSTLRVDVVWDRYFDDSLKNGTRSKRGPGERTRVSPSTKIPPGW